MFFFLNFLLQRVLQVLNRQRYLHLLLDLRFLVPVNLQLPVEVAYNLVSRVHLLNELLAQLLEMHQLLLHLPHDLLMFLLLALELALQILDLAVKVLLQVMNVIGEFFYHFVDLVNVEIRLFGHFVTGVSGVLA